MNTHLFEKIKIQTPAIIYFCLVFIIVNDVISLTTFEYSFPQTAHFFNRIKKLFDFVLVFLVLVNYACLEFNKKKIFVFITLLFFVAFCKKTWIIFDLLFIPLVLSNFISVQKVYRLILYTIIASSLFIIALHVLNLLPDYTFSRNGIRRYPLGFNHPNVLGYIVLTCCFLFALINRHRNFFFTSAVLVLSALFVYYVPNSVTSFLCIIFFLLSLIITNNRLWFSSYKLRLYFFVLTSVFLLISFVSLYYVSITRVGIGLINMVNSFHLSFLDTFVARLNFANQAVNEYGFSLLGQKVKIVGAITWENNNNLKYFVIDSALFYLPIVVGILPSIVYFIVWGYCYIINYISKNYILYCIQIISFIYALSENLMITSCLCMFMFIQPLKDESK